MSPRVFNAGDEANAIIDDNIDGEKGQWGLLYDISRGMHNALAPSSSLDWMTKTMLTKLEEYIEPLGLAKGDLEMDLYKWVRKAITVASTEAVGIHSSGISRWHRLTCSCRSTVLRIHSTTMLHLKMPSGQHVPPGSRVPHADQTTAAGISKATLL